jgi:hypothetical protein
VRPICSAPLTAYHAGDNKESVQFIPAKLVEGTRALCYMACSRDLLLVPWCVFCDALLLAW